MQKKLFNYFLIELNVRKLCIFLTTVSNKAFGHFLLIRRNERADHKVYEGQAENTEQENLHLGLPFHADESNEQ